MENVVVSVSRRRMLPLILGCAAFAVLGAMMARGGFEADGFYRVVGAVVAVACGGGTPLLLWRMRDPRPEFVISDLGIAGRRFGLIEWSEIRRAELLRVGGWGGSRLIGLEVRDPGRIVGRSGFVRAATAAGRVLGYPPVTLYFNGMDADVTEVFEIIKRELAARSAAAV